MSQEIFHKGYQIAGEGHQNEQGKWIPRAKIMPQDETITQEARNLEWPKEFDSQLEAEDFALTGAQLYIDEHY